MQNGPYARQFNDAVAAKMREGMDRRRAVTTVVGENPLLHQQYLAEFNGRPIPHSAGGTAGGPDLAAGGTRLAGEFNFSAAVDRHVAAGKSRGEAIKLAAAEDPDLPGNAATERPQQSGESPESGYAGDAVADFDAAVKQHMAAGKSRPNAVMAAVKEDPARHKAYIEQYTAANWERTRR